MSLGVGEGEVGLAVCRWVKNARAKKQQTNSEIVEDFRLEHGKAERRGDNSFKRINSGENIADFRESLALLLYSIHCCVESETTAAGGCAVLFPSSTERRPKRPETRKNKQAGVVGGCRCGFRD